MKRFFVCAFGCAPRFVRGLVALSCLIGLSNVIADESRIVLVEENWELVVGDADAETVAPQITCTISPRGNLNGAYATFELNHASVPSFSAGGLNLHLWEGSFRTQSRSHSSLARLQTSNEVIRWTTVMAVADGKLFVGIRDGNSQTWGDFGLSQLLCVGDTNLPTLSGYSPEASVQNSGVGYASNRVESLKIKSVRRVNESGESTTDETVRTVFSRSSN